MERNLASSLLLCVLATTAASQEGSRDCRLGNAVPVCDYVKFLIRKPLAPGSATCLFELLLGYRYCLSSPSSLPSNGALATTVLEEQGWQQAIVCIAQSVSRCCRGHARCVTSGCKSRRHPAWYNKKMGVRTVVWRKHCRSRSQTVRVSRND